MEKRRAANAAHPREMAGQANIRQLILCNFKRLCKAIIAYYICKYKWIIHQKSVFRQDRQTFFEKRTG